MKHRITLETNEVLLQIDALENRRENILMEMLAPNTGRDELVEAAEAIRQLDRSIVRFSKLIVVKETENEDA